ncbi:hypothetical protein LPTSP3_g25890 [Leptospira kobayashii]|uniref:Uncharacterized protein n=1 Tax=Leptospira kobayashii TaxID=1917830 RepID=A0ABN6KGL5_9LEPT|nr:hypothetical protein [Leptospira kobayashii]BDA79659.1 hypothetical protein LPTSP3_g25890 [Leptospira kobayashii]
MILNETFASNTHHFEIAKRAQVENPNTYQNQVVELQKAAITTQNRAQTVPETKANTSSNGLKPKQEKEEVVSYTKSGIVRANLSQNKGSFFDSMA